ncbi:unnamed protein product [Arctia plantaginis]|uniref:Uncharacterized protein n=1 Tax=Arctia plantaginis TaxID=874455 RepID=A0A8S1B8G6_ARCPL|nr:unnamed protein product [Arctia plantaginis]
MSAARLSRSINFTWSCENETATTLEPKLGAEKEEDSRAQTERLLHRSNGIICQSTYIVLVVVFAFCTMAFTFCCFYFLIGL